MPIDFLQFFPYDEPRPIQEEMLIQLSNVLDSSDVVVVSAPTAFGKSSVAKTILDALYSVSYITPTNQLVGQFLEEFPGTPTLARLDSYWCEKWQRPCPVTRSRLMQFCSVRRDGCACPASGDLSTARFKNGPGAYNYHTYLAHRIYRDVLVVDEAHNLLSVIRERNSLRIWAHDFRGFPSTMYSTEQILSWVETLTDKQRNRKKMSLLEECLRSARPKYVVERTQEEFNGKGTVRGQPEMRDCLRLLPVDVSKAPPLFWPTEVKKIILLSATIGPKDIEALGLGKKRVTYIDCTSPIPAENRPIVFAPIGTINRSNVTSILPRLAAEIVEASSAHEGEKGLVHLTYQLAQQIRPLLEASTQSHRFIYHDRNNKQEMFDLFRNSNPGDGAILVASGMYEGVDLPYDAGRWQVIGKIPWGSLGSPAVKYQAEQDPEWYLWQTVRTVIQACGRICRTPEDFGITYVLDGSFERLYQDGEYMFPAWFKEAVHD